jgi:hypothetical protein
VKFIGIVIANFLLKQHAFCGALVIYPSPKHGFVTTPVFGRARSGEHFIVGMAVIKKARHHAIVANTLA